MCKDWEDNSRQAYTGGCTWCEEHARSGSSPAARAGSGSACIMQCGKQQAMCCHGAMLCCLPMDNCPHRSRPVLRAPGECSTLQQHRLSLFVVLPRQQAAAAELLPHGLHGCAAMAPDRAPAPRAAWPSACPNDSTAAHCGAGHQVQAGGCSCPAAPLSIWSASTDTITTADFSPNGKSCCFCCCICCCADHVGNARTRPLVRTPRHDPCICFYAPGGWSGSGELDLGLKF